MTSMLTWSIVVMIWYRAKTNSREVYWASMGRYIVYLCEQKHLWILYLGHQLLATKQEVSTVMRRNLLCRSLNKKYVATHDSVPLWFELSSPDWLIVRYVRLTLTSNIPLEPTSNWRYQTLDTDLDCNKYWIILKTRSWVAKGTHDQACDIWRWRRWLNKQFRIWPKRHN